MTLNDKALVVALIDDSVAGVLGDCRPVPAPPTLVGISSPSLSGTPRPSAIEPLSCRWVPRRRVHSDAVFSTLHQMDPAVSSIIDVPLRRTQQRLDVLDEGPDFVRNNKGEARLKRVKTT